MRNSMFLKDGCCCMNVEHVGKLSLGDLREIFKSCPQQCNSFKFSKIDGIPVIILPECASNFLSEKITERVNHDGESVSNFGEGNKEDNRTSATMSGSDCQGT